MHESWKLKRELADSVSNRQIDEIYDAGREAGAIGGKLLGAGGGGFMLFLVDPERREQVRARLKDLIHVNIGFDNDGSKIVLYQPDGLMTDVTVKGRRLAAANSKWKVYFDHIVDRRGNEVLDYLVLDPCVPRADHVAGRRSAAGA